MNLKMRRLRLKVTAREKQQDAEQYLNSLVNCNLDSWFYLVPILCICDISSVWLLILFHSFERSSEFLIHVCCFLNSQDIFQARHVSLHSGISPYIAASIPDKKEASLPACPVETQQRQIFFRLPVTCRLSFLQLFCMSLSKVETFKYNISKFSVVFTILLLSQSERSKKCGVFPGITLSYFVITPYAEGIKQKV